MMPHPMMMHPMVPCMPIQRPPMHYHMAPTWPQHQNTMFAPPGIPGMAHQHRSTHHSINNHHLPPPPPQHQSNTTRHHRHPSTQHAQNHKARSTQPTTSISSTDRNHKPAPLIVELSNSNYPRNSQDLKNIPDSTPKPLNPFLLQPGLKNLSR